MVLSKQTPSKNSLTNLFRNGSRCMASSFVSLARASTVSLRAVIPAILVAIMLSADLSVAQGFRRGAIAQNTPPESELIVARMRYGTNGRFGHMGWSHNYPSSDEHLNQFIAQATLIDLSWDSYRIVELGSDEIFDHPFAYISEPGEMLLTEEEVGNLREYIDRGGFILMDDFDGYWQLNNMMTQVKRAFPDRAFVPLSEDHPVFSTHFALNNLNAMSPYVPGEEITYYGLFNEDGTLAIAAGHNNDLANFWDWYDQPQMPLKPATDAFRLGTNFVIWSFTH